jgi:hypothetical protein
MCLKGLRKTNTIPRQISQCLRRDYYSGSAEHEPRVLTRLCFSIYLQYYPVHTDHRNLDSSVIAVMGYGLDTRVSNPGKGKIFLFSTTSKSSLGPTHPIQWAPQTISLKMYWPGREADHSPSASAEVIRGGAIPIYSWYSD